MTTNTRVFMRGLSCFLSRMLSGAREATTLLAAVWMSLVLSLGLVACQGTVGGANGPRAPGAGGGSNTPDGVSDPSNPNDPDNPSTPFDPPADIPGVVLPGEDDPNRIDAEKVFNCPSDPGPQYGDARLWRMNGRQYLEAVARLMQDRRADGLNSTAAAGVLNSSPGEVFTNVAALGGMDMPSLEVLLTSGALTSEQRLQEMLKKGPDRGQPLTCVTTAAATDTACLKSVVTTLLQETLRRAPSTSEIQRYADRLSPVAASQGMHEAWLTGAILASTSPEFLFRAEIGEGADSMGRRRLSNLEIAYGLSYTLVNTAPDSELMAAAQAGQLSTTEQIATHVRRLVSSTVSGKNTRSATDFPMVRFMRELVDYPAAIDIVKTTEVGFLRTGKRGKENQARDLDGDLIGVNFGGGKYKNQTDEWLASIVTKNDFVKNFYLGKLGSAPDRAGILTEPSVLWRYSQPDGTDPIRRGKFVTQRLLCNQVPEIDIGTVPEFDVTRSATLRKRLDAHLSNPECRKCHTYLDAIGLGLERFDDVGYRREVERLELETAGEPLVTTGYLVGAGEVDGPFDGPTELSAKLASSARAKQCIVRQVFRFVSGRNETEKDACVLKRALESFSASGRLEDVAVEYFTSDVFLYRK
jgi:hypothetical protein